MQKNQIIILCLCLAIGLVLLGFFIKSQKDIIKEATLADQENQEEIPIADVSGGAATDMIRINENPTSTIYGTFGGKQIWTDSTNVADLNIVCHKELSYLEALKLTLAFYVDQKKISTNHEPMSEEAIITLALFIEWVYNHKLGFITIDP